MSEIYSPPQTVDAVCVDYNAVYIFVLICVLFMVLRFVLMSVM